MRGEPVSNGTSVLLHFFSRTKMIEYLCKKYTTNLSLIFNISILHHTQTNQSIVNYFEDQRYQSFKSKNVDSKYEQNVSHTVKRDEKKNMPIFIPNIQGIWCINRKERSTKNVTMKREKSNAKSQIKERRKHIYKSQTKQCDDPVNRQKRNCKNIDAQRKIKRKLKSKKYADIQFNTQIKNVECVKVNGTQNHNIKKHM